MPHTSGRRNYKSSPGHTKKRASSKRRGPTGTAQRSAQRGRQVTQKSKGALRRVTQHKIKTRQMRPISAEKVAGILAGSIKKRKPPVPAPGRARRKNPNRGRLHGATGGRARTSRGMKLGRKIEEIYASAK